MRALIAEFIGTFWLVLGGCGAAVFAAKHIGFHGVALAFGLTVLTMAFAISHISGCHLNPAVTCGLAAGGRFPWSRVLHYIVAQCLGAVAAAVIIYVILTSSFGTGAVGGFAANGYGELSPDKYTMLSALVCELVMTFMFVMVIMGATDKRAPAGFAPIAIGLCLTLVHLISIPVTNTSVNPARSLSQALFAGGPYIAQLWLFWLAPIVGGVLAGIVYRSVFEQDQ
ncbi:MAG: aquaporin Z [Planctomycetaceae bacterium]|nr:aquaporin Z [Planctomycetaceae bacterium]